MKNRKIKKLSSNGWIDPNGKYYECSYGQHTALAYKIAKVTPRNEWGSMPADDFLESMGWIKSMCPMGGSGSDNIIFARWKKYEYLLDKRCFAVVSMKQYNKMIAIKKSNNQEFYHRRIFKVVEFLPVP